MKVKRFLALLFSAVLLLALLPAVSLPVDAAEAGKIPSNGEITEAGLYDISDYTDSAPVRVAANGVALTGTNKDLSVIIEGGFTLTLKDAHIASKNSPIRANGADCGIILVGDNSAIGNDGAGVNVPKTSSITIEGPGKLTAQGSISCAGIGGKYDEGNGIIKIQHATIVAIGSGCGAGIGSGFDSSAEAGDEASITIINSSVEAIGGNGEHRITGWSLGGAAGIGGGWNGDASGINIIASAVLARGGNGTTLQGEGFGGGAGIGGGGDSSGIGIRIDALSVVCAIGGDGGAGYPDPRDGLGASGGGGAGIGGGGKSVSMDGGNIIGADIGIGSALAAQSSGGKGGHGVGVNVGHGGDGARCGYGGLNGSITGIAGGDGQEIELENGGYAEVDDNKKLDLTSRPSADYEGYPSFSAVTSPSSVWVVPGSDSNFKVEVVGGTGEYIYQWQSSADGINWTDIAGENSDTLPLPNLKLTDNATKYRCVVNDDCWREAISVPSALTVGYPPVLDPDPVVSVGDSELPYEKEENGTVTVAADEKKIEEIISQTPGDTLVFDFSDIPGITELVLDIDPASFEDTGKSVTFSFSGYSLTVSDQMFHRLYEITNGKVRFSAKMGSLIVSVSQEGKEIDWYNYTCPMTISMPSSTNAVMIDTATGGVIPLCWYEGGIVYAKVYKAGIYDIKAVTAQSFSDTLGMWMDEAVGAMSARGVALGVGDNLFAPDRNVTRGEFITMLMRLMNIEPQGAWMVQQFDDAEEGAFYYDALLAAKALGIASGTGDNKFMPNAQITRQDMFVMLYKAMEKLNMTPDAYTSEWIEYSDWAQVADYAQEAVQNLSKLGFVSGFGGEVRPSAAATRAETAQVLYNILG